LALSASPGKNINEIQEIIKSLGIGSLEIRKRNDPEIQKYLKKT
jgi:ERCC4-related helicase